MALGVRLATRSLWVAGSIRAMHFMHFQIPKTVDKGTALVSEGASDMQVVEHGPENPGPSLEARSELDLAYRAASSKTDSYMGLDALLAERMLATTLNWVSAHDKRKEKGCVSKQIAPPTELSTCTKQGGLAKRVYRSTWRQMLQRKCSGTTVTKRSSSKPAILRVSSHGPRKQRIFCIGSSSTPSTPPSTTASSTTTTTTTSDHALLPSFLPFLCFPPLFRGLPVSFHFLWSTEGLDAAQQDALLVQDRFHSRRAPGHPHESFIDLLPYRYRRYSWW